VPFKWRSASGPAYVSKLRRLFQAALVSQSGLVAVRFSGERERSPSALRYPISSGGIEPPAAAWSLGLPMVAPELPFASRYGDMMISPTHPQLACLWRTSNNVLARWHLKSVSCSDDSAIRMNDEGNGKRYGGLPRSIFVGLAFGAYPYAPQPRSIFVVA